MYEGGDEKNRETFPCIPDEPSKPRKFSPSKLLSFTVEGAYYCRIDLLLGARLQKLDILCTSIQLYKISREYLQHMMVHSIL